MQMQPSCPSLPRDSPSLGLFEQEAALKDPDYFSICALAYQVIVSIQCGTCLKFLSDTKSLRFFKSCC